MSINIFGVVGEDVRASDILRKIQAEQGDTIEVNIMSPGGSVIEGLAIYDSLRQSGKQIITRAMGQAASIASIIFMAGDKREVADNAEIRIHNAMVFAGGNKHKLSEFIGRLDGIDKKLINIYATRTNLNEDQIRALLDNETFMDADEAVDKGFATVKADALALVAQYNKQTKEPVKMATEEETKEAGFFAYVKAYFNSPVKAMDEPEEEVVDVDGEDPKRVEAMEEEAPVKEEESEEVVDMEEEESEEVKALKGKIAALEEELESAPKAVKEEAQNVAGLVFDAVTDNKVTMHEAKNLCSKSLDDVKAVLSGKEVNATGRGKAQAPTSEAVNHREEFNAIAKEDPARAQAYYKKHVNEIRKES